MQPTVSQSQASSTAEESHEESTVQESDVDIDLMAESDSDSEESNNGKETTNYSILFRFLLRDKELHSSFR